MKIYLAVRFGRQEEMKAIKKQIVELGYDVVSRWLEVEFSGTRAEERATDKHREKWSLIDYYDVKDCDTIVNFTEPPDSCGRGGRHVEFGLATAWGKRLVVIGYRENVFHHLPQVEFYETLEQFLAALEKER